jgi:hypothetical protein
VTLAEGYLSALEGVNRCRAWLPTKKSFRSREDRDT